MKKFNYIVAALALLSGAMFCSCVEDKTDLPLHNQHQIDFTASSDTEWQDATRAAEEEPQVMILEMEGDEDLEQPLYLHITCEDREDPTAEELFGEEATRGNVTTTENFVDKFGTNGFGLFAYVYKPGEWSTAKSNTRRATSHLRATTSGPARTTMCSSMPMHRIEKAMRVTFWAFLQIITTTITEMSPMARISISCCRIIM